VAVEINTNMSFTELAGIFNLSAVQAAALVDADCKLVVSPKNVVITQGNTTLAVANYLR